MCRVEKCCCCCELSCAVKVFSWIFLVLNVIVFIYFGAETTLRYEYGLTSSIVFMIFHLLLIGILVMLIVGTYTNNEQLLLIWLIVHGVLSIFQITEMALLFLIFSIFSLPLATFVLVIFWIVVGLHVYFWICVYSLYKLMTEGVIGSPSSTGKQIV
jgi:hypothetical protein